MIRYLTKAEILFIHAKAIEEHGGAFGILNAGAIDSALAQTQGSFAGQEFYPTPSAKAAALGFSLIMNHPFVDGNKRVGFAAMKTFLLLNDHNLTCTPDDGETAILSLCEGKITRDEFVEWVDRHSEPTRRQGE